MTTLAEALDVRRQQADQASNAFDFEREGSLATFWRQATPGTTYWRGHVPMKYLPGQVLKMEEHRLFEVEGADPLQIGLHGMQGAAIWQFLGDDSRSRMALQLKRQGVRTIMELDDNYLRNSPILFGKASAWTKTHAEAMEQGTGYSIEMHRKVVPQMDALIVSTENLADEYDRFLSKAGSDTEIYVCPNSVDPTDWNVERVESDVLRIGYYGSPSHVRDFPLVKKALKWAARQPDVEVVMIGFTPAGSSYRTMPWADNLFDARAHLGHLDVGIAPLAVNPWSVGKSDVKMMEYAMAGAMPIGQDAPPYAPWKDEWGWEWMARTESDWFELIQEVVKNRDLVPDLAASARGYVERLRTIQGNIHRWKAAVDGD